MANSNFNPDDIPTPGAIYPPLGHPKVRQDQQNVIDPNMVTHNSEGSKNLSSQLVETIDKATAHIIKEMDGLTEQIESMKARVQANSESAKRAVMGHFVLAAEASIFAASIHTKLTTRLHEAQTLGEANDPH